MRKLTVLAVLLLVLPIFALAGGMRLDPTKRLELTDCATNGGDAGAAFYGTLTEGEYLLRITDSDVFVCFSETLDAGRVCPSGGEKLPSGTVIKMTVGRAATTYSCRSAAGTGDLILTKVE